MSSDPSQQVIQEMTYTTFEDSCGDSAVTGEELRQCRRSRGHSGEHASNYPLVFW